MDPGEFHWSDIHHRPTHSHPYLTNQEALFLHRVYTIAARQWGSNGIYISCNCERISLTNDRVSTTNFRIYQTYLWILSKLLIRKSFCDARASRLVVWALSLDKETWAEACSFLSLSNSCNVSKTLTRYQNNVIQKNFNNIEFVWDSPCKSVLDLLLSRNYNWYEIGYERLEFLLVEKSIASIAMFNLVNL